MYCSFVFVSIFKSSVEIATYCKDQKTKSDCSEGKSRITVSCLIICVQAIIETKTAIMNTDISSPELSQLSYLLKTLYFNFTLPTYLQKLLIWTGFDNRYSISMMTAEDIAYMEQFARDVLADRLSADERDSFFGIFSKNLSAFRIMPGHVKLLKILIENCKTIRVPRRSDNSFQLPICHTDN